MCSKLVYILAVLFCFSACGLKTGEETPKKEIVELKNTKCLNASISTIKLFFDGTAPDSEVDMAFKCFSEVLIAFKDNINGANRDFFSAEELAYFIETNFLKGEYKFRSEFLAEILKLKFVLVGGSDKVFYKKDIEKISTLIERLRPEIVRINPEMKIISSNWDSKSINAADKEYKFLLAKVKAAAFFETISKELAVSGNTYEINNFFTLIKEIAIFAKASPAVIEKIETTRPFLVNFKKNLVGEGTEIKSKDWSKISKSLHEMLFQILRINYFLKPLGEEQLEEKWVVYQKVSEDSLQLVSTLLEAQARPVLSNEQVYELISSLLPVFSEQTIDEEVVESFAEIKKALLGQIVTSSEQWVPSDLTRIKDKLPTLFTEVRKMIALFKEMNSMSPMWKQSYADFTQVEIRFNRSIRDLLAIFDGEYSLGSAKKLLLSFDRNNLLPGFDLPQNFEGLYKASISLKYMLTGIQTTKMTNPELKHIFATAAAGYFHYLEYDSFIKPYSFEATEIYLAIDVLAPKFEKTVESVLSFKKSKLISTNEFLALYDTLVNEKLIQSDISLQTVSSILQVLWSHILPLPESRLRGQTLPGFNSEALKSVMYEYRLFSQSGKDLGLVFGTDTELSQGEVLNRLNQLLAKPVTALQYESLSELERVINGPVAMTLDQNKLLRIFDINTYKPSDLLQAQISKTLSRILIRSFSMSPASVQHLSGVTLPEAQYFFDSLKTLFFDLELISPLNKGFISSRFREANLFVSHANGDQLANFEELSDIIIHIFSGLERAKLVRDQVVLVYVPKLVDPISALTEVSEDWLLQNYFESGAGFESMPKYAQMKTFFSEIQNKSYYLSLLKAAGHIPNPNKSVKFDDANLFPHVVQYIEVLFSKYDLNNDDVLVKEEALLAYPVFKSTIKEMLKTIPSGSKITDDQLPGVFIYLLKYGRPPKGLSETLKFLGFISDEKQWVIQSNRLDLGVIFNFIADALATP